MSLTSKKAGEHSFNKEAMLSELFVKLEEKHPGRHVLVGLEKDRKGRVVGYLKAPVPGDWHKKRDLIEVELVLPHLDDTLAPTGIIIKVWGDQITILGMM